MKLNIKKYNRIILLSIILIIVLSLSNVVLGAGNFSISTSAKSLNKGESTTITVTANSCAGQFSISSSNSSVVSISSSSAWLDNSSTTITLTAQSTGTATITVTAVDVTDTELNDIVGSKTCMVTVTEPAPPPQTNNGGSSSGGNSSSSGNTTTKPSTTTNNKKTEKKEEKKSSDNSLSTLAVAEGVLLPEFNKDIKEYTLTVPNEVTTVNVAATTTDPKASYSVEGNAELVEGENIVTIKVKAEDGTTADYVIKVTRARPELVLNSIIVKYKDKNGDLIEIPLNPIFTFDILEYNLEDLEYWVEQLDIEAIANIEGATIEIEGADELQIGENTITITVRIPLTIEGTVVAEGEIQESEEIKTYTIRVNVKEEPVPPPPPTLMGTISNWFNDKFAGISTWYIQNQIQIIMGALAFCIVSLIGLSIYIIVDYKKYKVLLDKLKIVSEINNTQTAENAVVESIENVETIKENIEKEKNKKDRPKGGKHF